MITISSALRQAIQNGAALHEEIVMTLPDETVLTLDEEIMQGENTIVDQADSSAFPVGAAICKYITFTLDNSRGQFEGVSFFGAVCNASLKATVNNAVERIPKGRYTVLSPVSYGEIVEITAADDMYKADKTYSTTLTLPQTLLALVQDACTYCGITCGFSSMVNGSLQITQLPEDMTFREFFGYAAAIAGGNARIDVENRLQFVPWDFSTQNPYELRGFADPPVIGADEIQITGVQVSVGDVEEEQFLYGDVGYVISIENPLCAGLCETVARSVGTSLIGHTFRSMEGEVYADPTIEAGDMAVSYDRKGNSYLTPITDVTYSLFGRTAVKTQAEPPIRSESLFTSAASQTLASAKRLLSIYAENGYFSGELRAATGVIGGWTINANSLQSVKEVETGVWKRTGMVSWGPNSTINSVALFAGCPNQSGSVVGVAPFYVTQGGKLYCDNAEIEGKVTAASGSIGGWSLTSSAIYRTNSSFGNADGMYFGSSGLSIKDKFQVDANGLLTAKGATFYGDQRDITVSISDCLKITENEGDSYRARLTCQSIVDSITLTTDIWPSQIRFHRSNLSSAGVLCYTSAGKMSVQGADLEITGGHITIPTSKSLKGLDTNGNAKSLIYMTGGDNVRINGDQCGITNIATDTSVTGGLTATGDIKSTSGKLVANNCTAWNGGVAGGLINENGTAVLVGPDANNLPRIVFVRAKSTTQYSVLRALNSSGTYTLTLPNATGTLAVSSSDVRLKEHIKPTKVSALDLIDKIQLHQYDWKAGAKEGNPHWRVGMIADELEQLDKNLVFGGGELEDGTPNVKGIDMLYLLGYVIKAIQELKHGGG